MYKIYLPILFILVGVLFCLRRNYPRGYMSTPSYPKMTPEYHFLVVNSIKNIEKRIKNGPSNQFILTVIGIILILSGVTMAIIFYYI